jgi:hypothetical protein
MEQGRKQNSKQIDRLLQRIEIGKVAAARKLAVRFYCRLHCLTSSPRSADLSSAWFRQWSAEARMLRCTGISCPEIARCPNGRITAVMRFGEPRPTGGDLRRTHFGRW